VLASTPTLRLGRVHRSLSGRVIALVLAFLASFSAPGAALAHGAAHHREHRGDHARAEMERQGDHDHRDGHPHHGHVAAKAVIGADQTAAEATLVRGAVASHDERDGSHGHPTLDLPVRPRVELAVILPLVAVAALIATPEIEVAGGTPVPHAALPRPDPDAAPPPRTRAPPLR